MTLANMQKNTSTNALPLWPIYCFPNTVSETHFSSILLVNLALTASVFRKLVYLLSHLVSSKKKSTYS